MIVTKVGIIYQLPKEKRVFQEKRYQSSRHSQKKRESSEGIQKSVGDFRKNIGDFLKTHGDFFENVGDNFRNVGVLYLTAWRRLQKTQGGVKEEGEGAKQKGTSPPSCEKVPMRK